MQIEIWKFENADTMIEVDLEGIDLTGFFDCVCRAADEHLSVDNVVFAPKKGGWNLFGDGQDVGFGMELEIISGSVFVTPLYFNYGVVALLPEELVLLLRYADTMLAEPTEADAALKEILDDLTPKAWEEDVDEVTGIVDDDDITVEIILDEDWVIENGEYTLEGFGGTLKLTPLPTPV
ncbi:MAG: hypothetical protein U9Q03_01915 [Patescibacteria group bacterium]|nr:hypothetical protein [Patescibacteria group bacterium]